MLFVVAGATDTKVRRSAGGTTANSTNKYQKNKSVELGDQLHGKGPFQELAVAQRLKSILVDQGASVNKTFVTSVRTSMTLATW